MERCLVLETPRPLSFLVREKDGSVPKIFSVSVRTVYFRMAPRVKHGIAKEEGRVTVEPFSYGAYRIFIRSGKRQLQLTVADIGDSGVVVLPQE